MEYSGLADFDSKLNALKDSNCPREIIDKLVEELDSIINYDIKYRMGKELNN